MSKQHFHVPSLDGIRGLAALIVFVAHAGLRDVVPGGFGVTVFFFLSGYLITSLLRAEFEQTGSVSLRNFYLRRIYRILPPMYIVLVLAIVIGLSGLMAHHMTLPALAAQFAHLTNYYMIFNGLDGFAPATAIMWSLAVEEHFYLLFPLFISCLFGRFSLRGIAAILLLLCGLVLAWRCYLIFGLGVGDEYTYNASDTRLDSILYGCILAVWRNPFLDVRQAGPSRGTWIALLAASGALLLVTFAYRSETFRETFRYSLQGIALFPVFYCAVRFHHWPLFRWLESRPMRAMGLISYTFYLVHIMCIQLLEWRLNLRGALLMLCSFLAAVAVSTAMYFLVERRMGALRKRLHGAKTAAHVDGSRPIVAPPSA